MKKKSFIVIMLLTMAGSTKAQDYLISFTGTGASTTIDTVLVQNLIQGTALTLNGSDILNLVRVVGIPENGNSKGNFLVIHPNPVYEIGSIEFEAPVQEKSVIMIADVTGRIVVQSEQEVQPGHNIFGITGLRPGTYSVIVCTESYKYSGKLISAGAIAGNAAIAQLQVEKKTPVHNVAKNVRSVVQMQYNDGEQLLFTGFSGINATVMPLVPDQSAVLTFNFVDCTDEDGNHYPVVGIGTQVWMAGDLNVGARINGNQKQTDNNIIEKYCYNDDEENCAIYGGLYQWNEMMQYVTNPGVKGICPMGWHIPTDGEWTTLTTFLGDTLVAGGRMKEAGTIHWAPPNTGSTNSSGFTALPGGHSLNYSFDGLTIRSDFWSSTKYSYRTAWSRNLYYSAEDVIRFYPDRTNGISCRCLQDQSQGIPTLTTVNVTDITQTSAISGGVVTNEGGSPVTARGVCWSASPNPTISDSHTSDGSGPGTFTSYLTGLTLNTLYYLKAYATNSIGTAYGAELTFTTLPTFCPGIPIITYEGQTYHTVQLGDQCWFLENLNVGTRINGSQDQTNNGIMEKYCFIDDDYNCNIYGGLYQWEEMMQYVTSEGTKGICPSGWHIPTDAEWTILTDYLGGASIAGGKIKSAGTLQAGTGLWHEPNTGATNSSGFTALPGGGRYSGNFLFPGSLATFWSSTEYSSTTAWYRILTKDDEVMHRNDYIETYGFSCRCLFDNNISIPPIYLLGSATIVGWDNTMALEMTHISAGQFATVAHLYTGENSYIKFISNLGFWVPQWGTDNNGTSESGNLVYRPTEGVPDPPAIPAPAVEGDYYIIADTANLVYSVSWTSARLFLIGDATLAGWNNTLGIPFEKVSPGIYTLTTTLAPGYMKLLEVPGQWVPQWGTDENGTSSHGNLVYRPNEITPDPPAIPSPGTGTYTISVNLITKLYTISSE